MRPRIKVKTGEVQAAALSQTPQNALRDVTFHDVEQGSSEWFRVRAGKMTASHASEIAANGTGLETYVYKTLAAKHSQADPQSYTNPHMQRGIELEPQARSLYELEQGVTVEQVGFVQYGDYAGCSPDGLVGENGGLEIKCHDDPKHFRILINGVAELDKKYTMQIQMNLMITGREWWDYLAYNPNFKQSLIMHRIYPDAVAFKKLEAGLARGESLIQSIESKL